MVPASHKAHRSWQCSVADMCLQQVMQASHRNHLLLCTVTALTRRRDEIHRSGNREAAQPNLQFTPPFVSWQR
jgi:hypothetical protein